MYYRALVIVFALAAPILSRSASFRNLQDLTKRAVTPEYNNLPGDLQNVLKSKELPSIPLDDTGVYFVPAQVRPLETHFIDKSFLISNPVNWVPKYRILRTKKESAPKTGFPDETRENIQIYENKITYIQNEAGNRKNTRKTPSYFDVDVQEVANKERTAREKENNLIEDFESTERALVECLDLQILDYTRKHDAVDEFRDFWEARNLKSYHGLLNSDLHDRIRKYCSQPEFIIEQSLYDIKRGVPKKVTEMRTVQEKNYSNRRNGTNEYFLDSISPSSDLESFTSSTESTSIYDDTTVMPTTINESIEDLIMTTNDNATNNKSNNTKSFPFTVQIEKSMYNTEDLGEKSNSTEETQSGATVVTTESTFNLNNSENHLSAKRKEKNTHEDDIDMDTMASEVILTTHDYDTSKSTSDDITTFTPPTTSVELSSKIIEEDNFSIYEISTTPVPTLDPQTRNKYKENEIKIPKIITRECINNTVQSTLDGNEVIPNNDFGNLAKSDDNYSELGPEPLNESATARDATLGDEDLVSGNLYFGFNNEFVPIRFQQTNSGKINLGIDGDSLCEKLFRTTNNKSLLMTTLCNCVQNNMLHNNSTKT